MPEPGITERLAARGLRVPEDDAVALAGMVAATERAMDWLRTIRLGPADEPACAFRAGNRTSRP